MHPLQKQFHDFLEAHHLVEKNDKVLLAVSGGVDSMVMLELFRNSELAFSVAHCNFGLRGKDADEDEALVNEWANRYSIRCHVEHMKIGGNSVQLDARTKRYQWFDQLMRTEGYDKLATAHHLDDSLETTLLNLARGTGIQGLKGIPIKNSNTIRPLLFASKKQVLDFAHTHNLEWREDLSNQKADYDRNKLRLEVVPKLKELNPSFVETYSDTKERVELAVAFLSKSTNRIITDYFNAATKELRLHWLIDKSDLILLNEILSAYGFNYKTVKEIHDAIGKPGKRFPGRDHEVVMDRASLFIREKKERGEQGELVIHEEGSYFFEQSMFQIQRVESPMKTLDQGKQIALLDASKVSFPAKIRRWKAGDSFVPLGMQGRKKVSDFLIDQKVSLVMKEQVLVLEVCGEIAWVIGYRISEKFKVEKEKNIVRIERNM